MFHLHIKESSEPYRSLDGIIGIRSHRIQAVQHEVRIHITKALTGNVSQIRFGKPVLQSSHHPVHLVLLSVQVQGSESFDVFRNLIHKKASLIESEFIYSFQKREQRIGTMIYTMTVNPQEAATVLIIFPSMEVGNKTVFILLHEAIHQSSNHFRIDSIRLLVKILIVF